KQIFAFLVLAFQVSTAQAFPYPTNWQPILSCDDGAVVDINTYERRMVQVVIRNAGIYQYFKGVSGLPDSAMRFNDSKKEIVVPAELSNGVFNPGEFQGFQANSPMRPAIRVYRQGNGLKIEAIDLAHFVCTNYRYNDYFCAEGYWTNDQEVANWYFQSCH